ncbi:MAG: hypothetical protein AAGA55_03230, partial [Planctomycetota bacterium]
MTSLPSPDLVIAPDPIPNNSGKFMAPYTQDEVLAEWVSKTINTGSAASVGGAAGAAVGSYAANQALGSVPFVGGFLGQMVGSGIAREAAISAAGGME